MSELSRGHEAVGLRAGRDRGASQAFRAQMTVFQASRLRGGIRNKNPSSRLNGPNHRPVVSGRSSRMDFQ